MDKVVRAIDVGYGNVKYVMGHADLEKDVVCALFPSRAVPPKNSDMGAVQGSGRNTVRVKVGESFYEVGPDIDKMNAANEPMSIRTPDFCMTDQYMARMLGAFHYMFDGIPGEEKVIDVLVLGLPVNTYDQFRVPLSKKMVGTHHLPFGRHISVKDVRVFAQPFGGFFNFLYDRNNAQLVDSKRFLRQTNLIIDPGHYTFDWLVSQEMIVNPSRTSALFGGVSALIEEIAKSMHAAVKKSNPESSHARIESALRNGDSIVTCHGQDLRLDEHMTGANVIIEQTVATMATSVGDGADIDNVILVGGGARLWKNAVQKLFSGRTIIVSERSVFANVTGFQLAAERRLMREALAAAAA